MPYIRDWTTKEDSANVTTHTANMPTHETNDLLLWIISKDDSTAGAMSTPAGWTSLIQQGGQSSLRSAVFYQIAASAAVTAPTTTNTDTDAIHSVMISIDDVNTSTPIESNSTSNANAAASQFSQTSITTQEADELIIYAVSMDGTTTDALTDPGASMFLMSQDANSTNTAVAWYMQRSAGATPTPSWTANLSDEYNRITIGVRNATGGRIPAYVDDVISPGTLLNPLNQVVSTTALNGISWPTSLSLTMLGNKSTTFDAAAAAADFGLNPYSAAESSTPALSTTNQTGFEITFSSNQDLSSGLVGCSFRATDPRDALTDLGKISEIGGLVTFGSTVANVALDKVWQVDDTPADTAYVDETTDANSAGNADFTPFPGTEAINDYCAFGSTSYFTKLTFDNANGTAGVGGVVSWQYWNSTTSAWTALTGVTDGTTSFTAAVGDGKTVTWTGATNWGTRTINGSASLYYVRAIITTTYTTNPVLDQAFVQDDRYASYHFVAADSQPDMVGRGIWVVQPNQLTTAFARSIAGPTTAAINKLLLTVLPIRGAMVWASSELHKIGTFVVAGGDSNFPVDAEGIALIGNCFRLPVIQRTGSSSLLSYAPIQIGGGDVVNMVLTNSALQFPRIYSTAKKEVNFHASTDAVGIAYKGSNATDIIEHTNSVITSPSSYYWTIASGWHATAASNFNVTGLTVVNATITLNASVPISGMTFSGCGTIDPVGATFTNNIVDSSRATSAMSVSSTAEMAAVTDCTFTDNNDGDIGHSIQITATGSYAFDNIVFSGGGVAERSFNTTTGVAEATDIVTVDAAHGYTDGDAIYYQDQGGSQNMGLTDGSLYYVNSQSSTTLSFHTTKANAIADTSRVALTSAGGETHYIYSAKADVYNSSGVAVTINVSNGGSTPTVRNSDGSATTVNNQVSLTVTVTNRSGSVVSGAQVWIQKQSTDSDVGHPGNPFTSATGNNQGDADFVVNETPPSDLPSSGWIRIKTGRDEQTYRYASRSGKTFTFNTQVTGTDNGTGTSTVLNETSIGSKDIVEGDSIRNTTANPNLWATVLSVSTNSVTTTPLSGGGSWASAAYSVHRLATNYKANSDTASVPLMNEETNGSGVATEQYNYPGATKAILVKIRKSSSEPQYLPFSTTGTIISSGFSLSATIDEDTIVT